MSFHVQAVVPVIMVKPTDTLPVTSVNISPLTNIPTSLTTWEVLKIVAPFVQKIVLKSSTFPRVFCFQKLCINKNGGNNKLTSDSSQSAHKDNCFFSRLPYISPSSITMHRRIKKLVSKFCSDLDIKLVFTQFKIKSWFAKDPIPADF